MFQARFQRSRLEQLYVKRRKNEPRRIDLNFSPNLMAPVTSANIGRIRRYQACSFAKADHIENKSKRRPAWTLREKKTLLRVLEEFGHKDIPKIANYLPCRTEKEIVARLHKHKVSALHKFKSQRRRLQSQESFDDIHPWMSFVNQHCNSVAKIHDHLVAYLLPIFERYATLPTAKFGAIDFKAAYRVLFSALTMQKFPDDVTSETFSMIYASMKLLLKETAASTEDEFYKTELSKCLGRHFENLEEKRPKKGIEIKNTLELPEVNVLQFTAEELGKLCEVKD